MHIGTLYKYSVRLSTQQPGLNKNNGNIPVVSKIIHISLSLVTETLIWPFLGKLNCFSSFRV